MSELEKCLLEKRIDEIEDDELFCEKESEAVYEYCRNHNFQISIDDLRIIRGRGLEIAFESWKENYEEDLRMEESEYENNLSGGRRSAI